MRETDTPTQIAQRVQVVANAVHPEYRWQCRYTPEHEFTTEDDEVLAMPAQYHLNASIYPSVKDPNKFDYVQAVVEPLLVRDAVFAEGMWATKIEQLVHQMRKYRDEA